ncbi:MAG: hypothetical protein ACKPJJ_23325, partial [Planctomycetaceae bacterium]
LRKNKTRILGNTGNLEKQKWTGLQVSEQANLPIFSPRNFFCSSPSTSTLRTPTIRPLMDGDSFCGAAAEGFAMDGLKRC